MAHHLGYDGTMDQTVDASIIAQRADENQRQMKEHLNKVVDGPQPLAAPDGSLASQGDEHKNDGKEHESEHKKEPSHFVSDKVIYNSIHRSTLYYATAWLWCGCFEPKYKITAEYVIGEEWYGCTRVTDSMAFENVVDVSRAQPCCYSMISCCCPCVDDMANIVLLGSDDTNPHGWTLKRLHRSKKLYEVLVKIVQSNPNAKKK